ncbi:hypothetical protein PsYK624_122500 [Phanerochaete sordida]|uniref:JmjC domain-containing protein n=1 Tax=Phanerochaete sordida TaxID=48140 RepID=A0A9P3LJB7_9APHY|nr:hypothetical protein PsYK624_122500 [Phanerochaete sordida]
MKPTATSSGNHRLAQLEHLQAEVVQVITQPGISPPSTKPLSKNVLATIESLDRQTAPPVRRVPQLTNNQKNEFKALWRKGYPVVVRVQGSGPCKPDDFVRLYGDAPVSVHISSDKDPTTTTLGRFFELWTAQDSGRNVTLRDFPPDAGFNEQFADLCEHFKRMTPFPDITSPRAFNGLLSHWPHEPQQGEDLAGLRKPDIGPKMYISSGDYEGIGSTAIHKDKAAAINIMLYTAPARNSRDSGAQWTVFLAEDGPKIRQYLNVKFNRDPTGPDLTHAGQVFLTGEMLRELWTEHGVTPFRFVQRPGQAVFVPVGAAHQVANLTPSIKIATDFLHVDDIGKTFSLHDEFRRESMESMLSPDMILWHTWKSLHSLDALDTTPIAVNVPRKKTATSANRERLARRVTGNHAGSAAYRHRCPHQDCADIQFAPTTVTGLRDHM